MEKVENFDADSQALHFKDGLRLSIRNTWYTLEFSTVHEHRISCGSKLTNITFPFRLKRLIFFNPQNYEQSLSNRIMLKKIHKLLKCKQTSWLRTYIEVITQFTSAVPNDFEKILIGQQYGMWGKQWNLYVNIGVLNLGNFERFDMKKKWISVFSFTKEIFSRKLHGYPVNDKYLFHTYWLEHTRPSKNIYT